VRLNPQNPPHIRSRETNSTIMFDAIIAMLPLYAMATYFYGVRALVLGLVGLLTAMLTDSLCVGLGGKIPNLRDLSAPVTGLIIPLLMPASVRYSIVVVAVIFGIVVAKHPFGGTGENIFNPAATGMAFAIICWPTEVFTYPIPFSRLPLMITADTVVKTTASPGATLALGGLPTSDLLDLLLGNVAGPMGAANILVLLTCLLYLAVRRVVRAEVTLSFLAGAALTALLFPRAAGATAVLYELMSGMLLFGAIFMVNDPVTSPKRHIPMMVYGAVTGIASIVFRHLGSFEESFFFALLVMNSTVWLLDLWGEHMSRNVRRKNREPETNPQVSASSGDDIGDRSE
jgi:electron transport complex protein RnfD